MKIVHLSHFDQFGGAARSAYRLHEGLRREGASSRMLVGERLSDDPDVRLVLRNVLDRGANRLAEAAGIQYPFLPSSLMLARDRWIRPADVVQLHNLTGGWFSPTALPLLGRGRKLVWCLHDMWAFTGHCGYSYDSERWLTGCGECPHLDSYPAVRRDGTHVNWRLKQLVYSQCSLTITAPSRWLADLARRSPLLRDFPIEVIPYGLDLEVFRPGLREDARRELGLANDTIAVLVVGLEQRKGAQLIEPILATAVAAGAPAPTLLVAGHAVPDVAPNVPVRSLGHISGEYDMARVYAAADVFLLPTSVDNLPNTLLEALACGTPVVASAVGGVPEAIDHGETGLVAELDAEALGLALAQVLSDEHMRSRMAAAARKTAKARFGLDRQARAYLELYARPD